MEFKDYYKILGVSKNASGDQIKKEYRKMARKYHPDVNKASDAEQKFKDIAEAYEVLKDQEKRKAYDKYGSDWKTIYSVLLGLSGLLPKQPGAKWPEASRKELRSLWDLWWREEHKWEEVEPLTRSDWNFSGLRPLNHPVRRLAALS